MCCRLSGCKCLIISLILFLFVLFFWLIASLMMFLAPHLIRNGIISQTRLGHDSSGMTKTTKKWVNPKYEIYFQVHVFSIINIDQVNKDHSATPHFEEKGPYSFIETLHKDVDFLYDDSRVTYRTRKVYKFDPNTSCTKCSLNDKVNIPNIALQELWNRVKNSIVKIWGTNESVEETNPEPFKTVKVGDLIFNGYEDELLVDLKKRFPLEFAGKRTKIALFLDKNGTASNSYEIYTGLNDPNKIGMMYKWNSSTTTNAWYKPEARKVTGRDGQMFPPNNYFAPLKNFYVFSGDICRTIKFDFHNHTTFDGLSVLEYHFSNELNNVDVERKIGYCNPKATRFSNNLNVQPWNCAPVGLVDISSCDPDASEFYFSQTHFYGANEEIRNRTPGVKQWAEKETTAIRIEPQTGVVISAQQFSQINLGVVNGTFRPLTNLSPRIIPLIWINETFTYDKETRDKLHALILVETLLFFGALSLYLLSGFFIIIIIVITCFYIMHRVSERRKNLEISRLNQRMHQPIITTLPVNDPYYQPRENE